MGKPINEAKTLLEDMALNNYHWDSERGHSKKGRRHEIDPFTILSSKVDALFEKVAHLQTTPRGSDPNGSFVQPNV